MQTLVDKQPTGTIYVAWDNADTHQDDEVEAVVRGAAGRLVLLYLPTYSPWLNPIEMLWRHFRREVTHCNSLKRSMRCSKRAALSLNAVINIGRKCAQSLALLPQDFRECT